MKSILTKGLLASAAAFAIAGAFAQVQTGEPTNGSKLGVTPPPSTSTTTDTSRLSTDCSTVAERQRSHQDGGAQLNANCGNKAAVTMGAAPAQPAVVGSTGSASSSTTASNTTSTPSASPSTGNDTTVASASPAPKKRAKADRG